MTEWKQNAGVELLRADSSFHALKCVFLSFDGLYILFTVVYFGTIACEGRDPFVCLLLIVLSTFIPSVDYFLGISRFIAHFPCVRPTISIFCFAQYLFGNAYLNKDRGNNVMVPFFVVCVTYHILWCNMRLSTTALENVEIFRACHGKNCCSTIGRIPEITVCPSLA